MLDLISFRRFYFIFHMNLKNNASYAHLLCTTQTAANTLLPSMRAQRLAIKC